MVHKDGFTVGRGWEVGGFHGWKVGVSSNLGKKLQPTQPKFFTKRIIFHSLGFFLLFSSELHFHSANGKLT